MTEILQRFFEANQPLVFYIYGLVFFVLGLAITLQSRRHSRLILARRLHWLAFFGFIHAFNEWGDVAIPIQAAYLPAPIIDLLRAAQLGLLAVSFTCLFQFGIDLLRPISAPWTWLRWLPISILILWSLAALMWITVIPISLAEWFLLSGIWARYIIGFPGAALAAYSLRRYASHLIAPLNEAYILRMLHLAALALAGYALVGGLIVNPGPYFPASWLNSALVENWLGIPVLLFRSLAGLVLTLAIIRILEIFELETQRKLSNLEESQILAAERERIGRDLHDRTLQSVYGVGLMLNVSYELLEVSLAETRSSLDQARLTLDQAIDSIRQHIAELRAQPTSLNLAEGLTKMLKDSVLPSLTEIELILDLPQDHPFRTNQVGHILAIAGEACNNVARHAHAKNVHISAQMDTTGFYLTVTDDGQGVPADYVAGYGLQNMHERARLLGSDLSINSWPGKGTSLRLFVPGEMIYAENYSFNR